MPLIVKRNLRTGTTSPGVRAAFCTHKETALRLFIPGPRMFCAEAGKLISTGGGAATPM